MLLDQDLSILIQFPEGFLVARIAHAEGLVNVIGRTFVGERGDAIVLPQVVDDSGAQFVPGQFLWQLQH